jgi:HK97 family phage portal protein
VKLFGGELVWRTNAAQLQPLNSRGGWWNIVREPFLGAWQSNQEIRLDNALTYFAVFACVTLIASDIGKLCLRLVQQDGNGIWTETDSPAFSPVLRRPNRYQTINKFIEQWIISKLIHGNTYVLLQRDRRDVVVAMYVLDPTRVRPLVATDGGVYYQLDRDDLSDLPQESVTVPASEIIHDTMCALFHPLVGVSPLYASAYAAAQGLSIQNNSTKFFANGSSPGGVLTAPGAISDPTAARLKAYWDANYTGDNVGKVAVLGDGLKYEKMSVNAVDAQLIEQLRMTAEHVCSTFHVPPYLVDIGPPPPYANFEPLLLKYHSQCIQSLTTNLEKCLDHGLGLDVRINGTQYGTEFDIDDLIWMDSATRSTAAQIGIGSGALAPDEARQKYYGLGPVAGGHTPYMQNQMWPLKQLSDRPTPAAPGLPNMPVVTPPADPKPPKSEDDDANKQMTANFKVELWRQANEAALYVA